MQKKYAILIIVLIATASVGIFLMQRDAPSPASSQAISKEEALRQAQEYSPEGACMQIVTNAVHGATGARYTFSNSCLPPGWAPEG